VGEGITVGPNYKRDLMRLASEIVERGRLATSDRLILDVAALVN
jgi:hypothetical protein